MRGLSLLAPCCIQHNSGHGGADAHLSAILGGSPKGFGNH
ncbi:hypothetical protein CaCOL14_000635 [Colletotrichum acutatum]